MKPRSYRPSHPRTRGFTLVELLVVMAFIAILAALAIPRWQTTTGKSIEATVKTDVRNALNAEEAYYAVQGQYVAFSVEDGGRADPPGFEASSGVDVSVTVLEGGGIRIVGRHDGIPTPWCMSNQSGSGVVAGEEC